MEILIFKSKLKTLERLMTMNEIVVEGFNKTGNKFSVQVNGSKGYLNDITISCEGTQKSGANVIGIADLFTEDGRIKDEIVSIFHSDENGVRIEI